MKIILNTIKITLLYKIFFYSFQATFSQPHKFVSLNLEGTTTACDVMTSFDGVIWESLVQNIENQDPKTMNWEETWIKIQLLKWFQ